MKIFVLFCFLLSPILLSAQDNDFKTPLRFTNKFLDTVTLNIPIIDNDVIYEGIVNADSLSKDELYNRARVWMANVFRNSQYVMQMDDRRAGEIIGKGTLAVIKKVTLAEALSKEKIDSKKFYKFTINISVKDNKYRYKVYDIIDVEPAQGVQTGELSAQAEMLTIKKYRADRKFKSLARKFTWELYQFDGYMREYLLDLISKMKTNPANNW